MTLGLIEGRFGRAWTWEQRTQVLHILAGNGYRFYHYGRKADRWLRREWRTPHPPEEAAALAAFARECRQLGVRFGIALPPVGSTHPFDA